MTTQTVIRTERDPITRLLLNEILIERIVGDDDHERQTTVRETRYESDGSIAYENRPMPDDVARVIIAEAEASGNLR